MKVFFSIICVALSLHISAGFSCLPTGIQRYPDWLMESCERFILCVDGVLHQMQCPYGLFFSPDQELCVSPHEANCNIEEPLCPFWWADPNERIYLGDGQDCGRFYQCHNGVPVGGSCSEGLVFDRNTNSCSPTATCEVQNKPLSRDTELWQPQYLFIYYNQHLINLRISATPMELSPDAK